MRADEDFGYTVSEKEYHQRLIAPLVLLAIGISIGIIRWPVSSDRAEQEIRRQIELSVGAAEVSIGSLRLSLLPYPKLVISDFKIRKEKGFSAFSEEAYISLSAISLFAGNFKPDTFNLVDPLIELPPDKIPTSLNETAEIAVMLIKTYAPTLKQGTDSEPFKIRLINGILKGAMPSPSSALGSLFVDLSGNTGGDLKLSGETVWHGQKFSVVFSSQAPTSPDLNTRAMALDLSADVGRIQLAGELNTGMFPHFEGKLDSSAIDLSRLSKVLAINPGVSSPINLSISGASKISRDGIVISKALVTLGSVQFNGGLNLKSLEEHPRIVATLATEEINATDLLRPYWPKADSHSGWRRDSLDASILPAFDLDLRISAERADLGVARVSDIALSLLTSEGKLDATLASAKVFNGSVKARLSLTEAENGLALKLHGNFDKVDSGAALLSLMGTRYFEGITSGSVALESAGNSAEVMMQNLSGMSDFTVDNGTLAGINIAGILKKAETRPLSLTGSLRGGTTEFDQITLKTSITSGDAELAEALINLPEAFVRLTGKVDIGHRLLAINGEATNRTSASNGQKVRLPFSITGPFDEPLLKPDIEKMLRGPETEQD